MTVSQEIPHSTSTIEGDNRPRFGIGHISITAADVATLTNFYTSIGMRLVVNMQQAAILELRGGTHIVVRTGQPGQATLDLIVDDINETHTLFETVGTNPSAITRGNPHDRFSVTDPEGNRLLVNSNHAIGPV